MKKACLFFVCTFVCLILNATNYYVDGVNGNNANLGTSPSQAFKVIQNAANLTNAGDTVFIMNGTYTGVNIQKSGANGAQIVYTNYPGHFQGCRHPPRHTLLFSYMPVFPISR